MLAKYDGSIKFDTKIDTKEFESGVEKLKGTAIKGFAAVGAAAAGGIAAATKAGMDFEEAMSSVSAISMATGEQYDMLKAKAQEMGEATKFTATQAANALEYLSLAGYTAEESCAALPQVLNLAAAGGMDLAYASDLLTDSMAVMGLGIDSMANFSDQLAMAASKSNTSVQQLGEAVLIAGGQAKLANMSVEEMNTALGILADKGIKGSEGGTALRNTLKNLYTPTKTAADELKALGINTADAQGNLIPMQTVLKNLNAALNNLTEADKMTAMGNIFDTRTIAAASALLDDCGSRWDELSGYLSDCDGAAEQMAETMNDNLAGQLTLAASAAEGLGIAVYDSISGTLKESVKSGAAEISALTRSIKGGELKPAIENVGKLFAGLANTVVNLASAALPPLINTLGFLGNNFKTIATLSGAAVVSIKGFKIAATVTKTLTTASMAVDAWGAAVMAATASGIVYTGQLTTMQIAAGLLTGKITLLTAAKMLTAKATAAMSAAWAANPVGIAIAGVAALTAGVILLSSKMNEQKTEAEMLTEKVLEQKQAYDELKTSTDSQMPSNMAQTEYVQTLANELRSLADASGYVHEKDRARAEFILGELNSALGTEYQMSQNQIIGYQGLCSQIDELIAKKRASIMLDAHEEEYKTAIQNVTEAQKAQSSTLAELTQKQEEYAQAQADFNESGSSAAMYHMWQVEGELKKLQKSYDDASATVQQYSVDISRYEEAQAAAISGNYDKVSDILMKSADDYAAVADAATQSAEQQKQAVGQKFAEAVIAAAAAQDNYNKNANSFNKQQLDDAVKHANEMGIEYQKVGGQVVDGMVTGINGKQVNVRSAISKLVGMVPQWARDLLGIRSPSRVMASAVGQYVPMGFAKGISDNIGCVKDASAEMANIAVASANDALDIHSPSRVGVEIGKYFDLGIAKGIEENSDSTVKAAKAMSEKLGYLKDFDVITEDEYYTKLEEIRDRYFAAGTKDWVEYTKKIYDYQKKLVENEKKKLEEEKKNISKIYDDIADYASKRLDEVAKKQESYNKKLMNFGSGLLTKNTIEFGDEKIEFYSLKDLHADIDAMREYNDVLASFRGRLGSSGLSEDIQKSLLDEIDSMNTTEAKEFMKLLNAANDEDYADYISVYGEKFKFAQKASAQIYDSEMTKAVDDSYKYMTDKLTEAGYEIPEGFFTSGTVSAEKFGNAFVEELDTQLSKIRAKIDAFNASLKIELNESSRDRRSGGNKTVSYDYSDNSSIVIHGSSGSSVRENIQQAKNLKTYWAHTARSTTKATRKG